MGMGVIRCLKILALLSLVPLALRAGSLLGHVAAPAPEPLSSKFAAVTGVSVPRSVHREAGHQEGRRRRTSEGAALAAGLSTARYRPGGSSGDEGGFGDDKRMAPSGSNPLHNLR